ncbi:hypothetical protein OU995_07730 [Roseateles sp. SL47]|uniref:hypothetical protein n=1 Tax=Roseateles sp. SL47 TaxID=2995138 RepID=UPI0022707629|nr:hypothetical protein [Roseateles sp. SL47]WAC74585.1 hypothetical protein OU995_07730 [Roseateles sp. SL47]
MIPLLIGVMVASTAATVGTTIYATEEQKKQTKETIKNQKENTLLAAIVDYGGSLNTAPGSIPTA